MKNYLYLGILFIASIVFYFALSWNDGENDKTENEDVVEYQIEDPIRMVGDSELSDVVIRSFIQDLLGADYQLLVSLFDSNMLDQDILSMNEIEMQRYAKFVGEKIKNEKELVKTRILNVTERDEIKTYKIELEFRDMTKKIISISIKDGKIVSPLESLE